MSLESGGLDSQAHHEGLRSVEDSDDHPQENFANQPISRFSEEGELNGPTVPVFEEGDRPRPIGSTVYPSREDRKRSQEEQARREFEQIQNGDLIGPIQAQVSKAKRVWKHIQHKISSIEETQALTMAQNHALKADNDRLRDEVFELRSRAANREDSGQKDAQQRSRVVDLIQSVPWNCQVKILVPIEDSTTDWIFGEVTRAYGPASNNEDRKENLLLFGRNGKLDKWFCLQEVCQKDDLVLQEITSPLSDCPVHGKRCLAMVRREKDKLMFRDELVLSAFDEGTVPEIILWRGPSASF
ncbi:hypothetical protein ACHAPJ_011071 [Fusarium lateritium]